jgi:hypothetical protein
MSKIEKQLVAAILAGVSFKSGNTELVVYKRSDGAIISTVYLHGNMIAQNGADGTWGFKLCGWNTPTTRSRINSIMGAVCKDNPGVHMVRGQLRFSQFGQSWAIDSVDWVHPDSEGSPQVGAVLVRNAGVLS